jgi:adenylylsulfate kinase-like enzyme
MQPAVFLLLGFPGTGKYTVAQALASTLAAGGSTAKVVDNHYVNNPIFGVLHTDAETPLPEGIWALVGQVRDAVLTAIEEHAPHSWSFIFTNFITADEVTEGSTAGRYLERLERLARSRQTHLNTVVLTCDVDELCRRIALPDRRKLLKATSATWARETTSTHTLYEPADGRTLSLDVTHLPPSQATQRILEHPWDIG